MILVGSLILVCVTAVAMWGFKLQAFIVVIASCVLYYIIRNGDMQIGGGLPTDPYELQNGDYFILDGLNVRTVSLPGMDTLTNLDSKTVFRLRRNPDGRDITDIGIDVVTPSGLATFYSERLTLGTPGCSCTTDPTIMVSSGRCGYQQCYSNWFLDASTGKQIVPRVGPVYLAGEPHWGTNRPIFGTARVEANKNVAPPQSMWSSFASAKASLRPLYLKLAVVTRTTLFKPDGSLRVQGADGAVRTIVAISLEPTDPTMSIRPVEKGEAYIVNMVTSDHKNFYLSKIPLVRLVERTVTPVSWVVTPADGGSGNLMPGEKFRLVNGTGALSSNGRSIFPTSSGITFSA